MAVSKDQHKKKNVLYLPGVQLRVGEGDLREFFGWSADWLVGNEDCWLHLLPRNTQKAPNTQGHQKTCSTLNYFGQVAQA